MSFLFSKKNNKVPNPINEELNRSDNYCTVHAVSETGPVRDHNEDAIAFSFPDKDHKSLIAIVADGMGGHNAGEVASQMACDSLLNYCTKNWLHKTPEQLLQESFLEAHQQIITAGNSNGEQQGMGTTATAVIVKQSHCYIGHIGDSRVYRLRNGKLQQMTTDHTLVHQMFENGDIKEDERDQHPMKNVLLQALGTTPNIQPQISTGWKLLEGDRLLLCSDGVYEALTVDEIQDLLLMKQPEFVLDCLAALATLRQASDNFSALLIDSATEAPLVASVTKEQNILS